MIGRNRQVFFAGFILLLVTSWILGGCSSQEVASGLPPEERFERAKALFDKGDYLDAINEFTVITLQYPGSTVAGDAQFYLGQSRYNREEYLLAAYEFQTLIRNMPASPRVPEAQYRVGVSYYQLAPKSRLDQQYTRRAIDALQAFVEYYPQSEYVPDATAKINELNGRLAKKEYDAARLYATMEYYKAAIQYYDLVIEKYHDTEYAPLAYLEKTELLIARKKFQEAKSEIDQFIQKYPNSVLRSRADKLKGEIETALRTAPAAEGKESGSVNGAPSEANLLQTR